MSELDRIHGAEAYVRALRTGEGSATRRAAAFLAPEVRATIPNGELSGFDAVCAHITGQWPSTPVYLMGGWSDPRIEGESVVVVAEFPAFGAGATGMTVTFAFDGEDRITSVTEVVEALPRPAPVQEIPLVVRGLINNALVNGTPVIVAYVGDSGEAELSLRGSTQVFSPTQISIWVRDANGGLPRSIALRPRVSLLYRDSRSRSTLVVKGDARVATDEATRSRVYEISPEVEQMHDPERLGAAVVIDVTSIRGGTPKGGVNFQP